MLRRCVHLLNHSTIQRMNDTQQVAWCEPTMQNVTHAASKNHANCVALLGLVVLQGLEERLEDLEDCNDE